MIHGAIAPGTSQYGMQTLRPVDLRALLSRAWSRSRRRCAGRRTSTSSSSRCRASRRPPSTRATRWPQRQTARQHQSASRAPGSIAGPSARPAATPVHRRACGCCRARELSVARVRAAPRTIASYPPTTIDAAIERLLETGALDDRRVAARVRAHRGARSRAAAGCASCASCRHGHRTATSPPRRSREVFGETRRARADRQRAPQEARAAAASRPIRPSRAPALSVSDAPGLLRLPASRAALRKLRRRAGRHERLQD